METQNQTQNRKYTILFKDLSTDMPEKVVVYVPDTKSALRIRDAISLRQPELKYLGLETPSGEFTGEILE